MEATLTFDILYSTFYLHYFKIIIHRYLFKTITFVYVFYSGVPTTVVYYNCKLKIIIIILHTIF